MPLPILKPLQHIAGDVGFLLTAQHDVHALDLGDFLAFELGIAARDHHQRVGELADKVADVLTALAVGQRCHATCVHHAHIGHLAFTDRHDAMCGKQRLHRCRLREVELAAQRLEFYPMWGCGNHRRRGLPGFLDLLGLLDLPGFLERPDSMA